MKKHTVSVEDLLEFQRKAEIVFASSIGKNEHKQLIITGDANYIVMNDKKCVYITKNASIAVEKYNEL